MNKPKGKLIVFEGTDGSGKTTQAKLLVRHLNLNQIPNTYISFPRYETKWGRIIRKYLDGGMGNLGPYDTSVFYANDRKSAAAQINKWLDSGKIVVCNRYIASNIGHMAAKLESVAERSAYIKWLEDLEYKKNEIPKEDLVILLQVPPQISKKLMKSRNLDIHEKDFKYQEEVYSVYDNLANVRKNWIRVDCTKDGKILPPKQIHRKVVQAARSVLVQSRRGPTSGFTRGRTS